MPETTTPARVGAFEVIPWDGKPITRPGIYSGIPMDVYHRGIVVGVNSEGKEIRRDLCDGLSVSSSTLRTCEQKSIEHAWDQHPQNPDADVEESDAPHFVKGRAVHTLFMGEEGFRERFAIRPETYPEGAVWPSMDGKPKPWNGNAKWCQAWLADAAKHRLSVLKGEDVTDIRGMAIRLAKEKPVQEGLLRGLVEHSVIFRDEESGLWVKTRPDCLPIDSAVVSDYKGCADAGAVPVRRSISEYGYEQQLALVDQALRAVAGFKAEQFVLVFQEWKRPHSVNIKPLHPAALYRGHQQNRRALNAFAEAAATGDFIGNPDSMITASLLDWKEKRLEADEKAGLLPELDDL